MNDRSSISLSALIIALDSDTTARAANYEGDVSIAIVDFIVSSACGSTQLTGTSATDPILSSEYTKLMTAFSYQQFSLDWHGVRLPIQLDPVRAWTAERLSWLVYVALRFSLKETSMERLATRVRKIAVHHGRSAEDMNVAMRLLSRLSYPSFMQSLAFRSERWSSICSEVSKQRTDTSSLVYTHLARLADRQNVNAYLRFVAYGGHEGCLVGYPGEELEPILFVSPAIPTALYLITLHMLKERIDDGSVFSDTEIPADSLI
jgi:hypothetical protein